MHDPKADVSITRSGLIEAWRGELFGEAISRIGAALWKDGEEYHEAIDQVRRVEMLVEAALFDGLDLEHESGISRQTEISVAEERAHLALQSYPCWHGLVEGSQALLPVALDGFVALQAIAEGTERMLADLLVAHEEALIAFMDQCALIRPVPTDNPLRRIENRLLHLRNR